MHPEGNLVAGIVVILLTRFSYCNWKGRYLSEEADRALWEDKLELQKKLARKGDEIVALKESIAEMQAITRNNKYTQYTIINLAALTWKHKSTTSKRPMLEMKMETAHSRG